MLVYSLLLLHVLSFFFLFLELRSHYEHCKSHLDLCSEFQPQYLCLSCMRDHARFYKLGFFFHFRDFRRINQLRQNLFYI